MSALGPRGLTVLSIAGIAGVFLGILGWTQRGTGLVTPLITGSPSFLNWVADETSPRGEGQGAAPADS